MSNVELVLQAFEDAITTREKNGVLATIIDQIYPNDDVTAFTITFASFDDRTQLNAVVEMGKEFALMITGLNIFTPRDQSVGNHCRKNAGAEYSGAGESSAA